MRRKEKTQAKKKLILKRKEQAKGFLLRKRTCAFCTEKTEEIDYKDVMRLSKFITERGKIVPRRSSGICAPHRRKLARAVKLARFIALLPFIRK